MWDHFLPQVRKCGKCMQTDFAPYLILNLAKMSTTTPALNRADLDGTLARISSKPNVSGALILTKETGAIIRSTLADEEVAKKYSLGVKSTSLSPEGVC